MHGLGGGDQHKKPQQRQTRGRVKGVIAEVWV
jgi:hypothetical protein